MDEPIAIIGLDARFPGDGDTPERFYDFLLAGRSARSEVPGDRFNVNSFWHPDPNRRGTTRVRHGHFLKGSIAAFDAPFFSITPKEAAAIDPQQRGMLECVYKALENAGIPLEKAAGTQTGVYVGCFSSDYRSIMEKDLDQDLKYAATGNVVSMLSNRVSWFYDLRGPSLTIDTACSSSLVALHQACNSLKLGETSMAVVGGCNLMLSHEFSMTLDKGGVLGPDGVCRSFDEKGNGYGRGEGFGVLVLKRMSDCIRDGDTIRAVIRNSGSNQDGRSPGITQPTKAAQVDLMRQVYVQAGLDMSLTRFFEAHGTGTSVGDPIEASGIGELFGPYRSADEPLYVGALKSNVGHLEGASGVAAVIKGVYTLERGVIPANTWLDQLNPKIQDSWHLRFPTKALPWPQPGLRRMSINSFGVGGANAHVVLDDALHFLKSFHLVGRHRTSAAPWIPPFLRTLGFEDHSRGGLVVEKNGSSPGNSNSMNGDGTRNTGAVKNGTSSVYANGNGLNGVHDTSNGFPVAKYNHHATEDESIDGCQPDSASYLFVWSSYDQDGILRVRDSLSEYWKQKSEIPLSGSEKRRLMRDLIYTLAEKRTHHGWRAFVLVDGGSDLLSVLSSKPMSTRAVSNPRLGFIFTGQGAQWAAMGKELMAYPVFQKSLYEADKYLKGLGCSWSLIFELLREKDTSRVSRAEFSQPLCTALQVALVDLLFSWGIYPHAIAGHSSGEVAAAYAAGYISRESAWKVAYHRGKMCAKLVLAHSKTQTGMAAVALTTPQTETYIQRVNESLGGGTLEVACMNSPESHTVSGDLASVEALVELLKSETIFARKLNVEMAYHSSHMRPIYDEYVSSIRCLEPGMRPYPHKPQFFSSTRGALASASELLEPCYWADNLVSPVRFNDAVTQMVQQTSLDITDLLEVGPHNALHGPLRAIAQAVGKADGIKLHTVLKRGEGAVDTALNAAGSLWARGHAVRLLTTSSDFRDGNGPSMLTDLPSYPFNHATEYWFESRISREARFPRFERHELLGAPVPDWNRHNAIWRHRISVAENPWLIDHKVFDDILYPAAGMLVMAIEASRQVSDSTRSLKGFEFSDVSFRQALRVPDEGGVESHFSLRPSTSQNAVHGPGWSEFQLFTLKEDEWVEHCRGFIRVEYEPDAAQLTNGHRDAARPIALPENTRGMKSISKRKMYSTFEECGNVFGPHFQTLEHILVGPALETWATVKNLVRQIKASMPYQFIQPHIIHPASLDGVIQASLVALIQGSSRSLTAFVPFHARNIWVSAKPQDQDDNYTVWTQAESRGPLQVESSFTATSSQTGLTTVKANGFILKPVPGDGPQVDRPSRHIAFHLEWKVDPTISGPVAAVRGSVDHSGPAYSLVAYESLALAFMHQALSLDLTGHLAKMPRHRQLYLAYMRHAVETSTLTPVEYDIDKLGQSPEGALIIAIGQTLPQILRDEIDPLEVFFNGKLADDFYQRAFGAERCFAQLSSYLDALTHKNPAMDFLEIGAGTGGTTKSIIRTLTQNEGRYAHYCFTDISPAFFEDARELFRDHSARMSYKVLNIEKSIEEQGFEAAKYDIIIAANVLHATQNIEVTLQNTRKLLKPGGKLLLYECTNPTSLNVNLVFGTLPGWWLSQEPHRKYGPLMTKEKWSDHLLSAGFSGLDAVFPDFPEPADQFGSVLVSTAVAPVEEPAQLVPAFIVRLGESPAQLEVAHQMSRKLCHDPPCQTVDLTDIVNKGLSRSTCILLADLAAPVLKNPSAETLEALKHIIRHSSKLLWLSRDGSVSPDYELLSGFSRVIRAEHPNLQFTTISFGEEETATTIVEQSLSILRASYSFAENTFRFTDGAIKIPRIVPARHISKHVQARTGALGAVEEVLGAEPRPLSLEIGSLSQLDTLRFEDDKGFDMPLAEHDVEFKVMATGASFRDLASVLGRLDGQVVLGTEAAGVVTRVGTGALFRVGDRVFGLCMSGAIKTYARACDAFLARMPDMMSWSEAAAIPFAHSAAYAVLAELGSIQEGASILVHSAAGGFGQAVTQLARQSGAEIFVTAGTEEKREFLHTACDIPSDHIFSSRDLSFKEGILQLKGSRGVDIVLNCLSGDGLAASWKCVAPFGRFIDVGLNDGSSHSSLNLQSFGRNIRVEQFDFIYLMRNDPIRAQRVFQKAMKLFLMNGYSSHKTPVVTYAFSRVRDAFRDMQNRAPIGRVVLEPHDDDIISAVPSRRPTAKFDPRYSIVIVGGLGGLGQAISRWAISRGAKNLILLSRSGASKPAAKEFLDEIKPLCQNVVAPACDVADREALAKCIEECLAFMPKIKGCIQGSMVLRDNLFLDMSLEEWNAALRPKVDASWNLHDVLGKDLDFFVLLSSTMGIVGNKEQANYAAGNTFKDSLARYRRSQGLPAVALNLPAIEDVGFVAEKPELLGIMRAAGNGSMPVDEVLAVLDYHCGLTTPDSIAPAEAQVILRPGLPGELAAQGIEQPKWMGDPLFSHCHQLETTGSPSSSSSSPTKRKESGNTTAAAIAASRSMKEAEAAVLDALLQKLSRVLSVEASNLDPAKPLYAYGVDSLVAVDVRAWLLKDLGSEVSVFDMTSQPSIGHLARTATAKNKFLPSFEEKTNGHVEV
ncbi:polyketide synthase [Xylariaceae sp. FL0594]|nr:polyketide synthase [Xylariaceae sp. FL0594]